MTLNLLFVTITIKRRKQSFEEIMHEENVMRSLSELKDRQYNEIRFY